jgi:hypothetical protein
MLTRQLVGIVVNCSPREIVNRHIGNQKGTLRGESSPVRRSGSRRLRCTSWRDDGSRAIRALRSAQARPPARRTRAGPRRSFCSIAGFACSGARATDHAGSDAAFDHGRAAEGDGRQDHRQAPRAGARGIRRPSTDDLAMLNRRTIFSLITNPHLANRPVTVRK